MPIIDSVKNPAMRNRPVPFWSWNDRLEGSECVSQIEHMQEQGIGGFFMHARGGLLTDYLSGEWFSVVKDCLAASRRLGMQAWAYDEDGWPSGFAAGMVNGKGVAYQQKYLRLKEVTPGEKVDNFIACYDRAGVIQSEVPADGGLAAYYEVNPYYVDTLDGRVTAEFLQSTHEQYWQRLNADERAAMRGFFTDEPQISRNGIPWSFILEHEYRLAYSDELLPRLPQLLRNIGSDCRQTRARFWRLITRLFSENFLHQIQSWCHAHNWELTGHLVLEETFDDQMIANGACMPHYEYFDIPGIDKLGRYPMYLNTPLQLFSAAAQTGRRQLLSETFACCGWAVNFADLKWVLLRQMVHGVNLICQHLEGYSLRGIRKRDYPASLFQHQPWWPYYHHFNDCISRLGTLLAAGEVRYDVLLLHGVSSAHLNYTGQRNPLADDYWRDFLKLSEQLESAVINHHYGDETLMERHGSVKGAKLVIGQQAYSTVIWPKLSNLSAKQVELLTAFAEAGGKMYGIKNDLEEIAFSVDGVPALTHPLLAKVQWFESPEELIAALDGQGLFRQQLNSGKVALNATRRFFEDFDGKPAVLCYIVNEERFSSGSVTLTFPAAAGLECCDLSTGEVRPVEYSHGADGSAVLTHYFEPAGDLALLIRDYAAPSAPPAPAAALPLKLDSEWQLADCTPNLLTLDHCRCIADGEELFANEYVLTVNDKLLSFERDVPVALEFAFTMAPAALTGQPLWLLIEHPEKFQISVNGAAIDNQPDGFFADQAFERIDIASALRAGANVIRLETLFHQPPDTYECIRKSREFESEMNKLSFDSEIEAVYLAGNFGVETAGEWETLTDESTRYHGGFVLTGLPQTLRNGDLAQQGLPFFAGKLTLRQEIELSGDEAAAARSLHFRNFYGNVLEIKINGSACGLLFKPDYICNIPAGCLRAGKNQIELTLVNSLRNMLGPFHLADGDSHAVCPWSFYKTAGGPFTAREAPAWNDGYCFVKFGIEG